METTVKSEAYQRGQALFEKLHGEHSGAQLLESLKDVCPGHIDQVFEWAFDGIMARPGLDLLTRQYLLIASCTTLGYAAPQLRATKEQVAEVILQMLFYAGGAATSNALRIAGEVFRAQGR